MKEVAIRIRISDDNSIQTLVHTKGLDLKNIEDKFTFIGILESLKNAEFANSKSVDFVISKKRGAKDKSDE